MKAARLVVLAVALSAGLGAAYLMMGTKPQPVLAPAPALPPPPPPPSEAIVVAARPLTFGSVIADGDLRWQPWPKDQLPPNAIAHSLQPHGLEEVKGAIVRSTFDIGDPLKSDRLVKGSGSGFMAAVLANGKRAVAIDLSDQGKSAAGGFILPNDRVDVIRTFHPDDAPGTFTSETILSNIRVLASAQSVQERSGERTVIGSTATLELSAEQAEKAILAQRTGQLTLALRAITDSVHDDAVAPQPLTMTIIRSGNASQARVR